MILYWILNSVLKEIAVSIIFVDSVEEMWKDLPDRFVHSNKLVGGLSRVYQRVHIPRVYQLKKLISLLTQQDSSISVC